MSQAFGESRTVPASKDAKGLMKQLVAKGLFEEQRDVWRLGAAIGLAERKTHEKGVRGTFQNINSLDPEEVLAAVMLGRFPDLTPESRLKKLVDFAEWGIREIARKQDNGTLDWAAYAAKNSK